MPLDLVGHEWIVDAFGCKPEGLRDHALLQSLMATIVAEARLKVLSDGFWHKFPGEGGMTALIPLTESHLTIHTFPESGLATLNLYCCRAAVSWPWESRLMEILGASHVTVRHLTRGAP